MDNLDNNEISVTQALNHVQSWLNAKDFQKAIQGCLEILAFEPANKRALALMKQAEEIRQQAQSALPVTSRATIPAPAPEPAPATVDQAHPTQSLTNAPSLESLQIEKKPEIFHKPGEYSSNLAKEKRKYFLAMLIPALLVVIIGGGVIWALANKQRKVKIDEVATTEIVEDTAYLDRNNLRQEDLSQIGIILENYKEKTGEFPSVSQVEDVILASNEFSEIPLDPMHNLTDDNGKLFAYIYAVYDTNEGTNFIYIISASFEDSQGKAYEWTRGASIIDYPDYRDTSQKNVHILGEAKGDTSTEEEEEEKSRPKVKIRRT